MAILILNYVIGLNLTEMHKYVLEKYVAPHYGAKTGDLQYDPRVDINNDGVIDLLDVTRFSGDRNLTFKTFGVTPLLWYQVALPLGLGLVGVAALVIIFRKR